MDTLLPHIHVTLIELNALPRHRKDCVKDVNQALCQRELTVPGSERTDPCHHCQLGTVVGSTNIGLAAAAAGMRKLSINLRFRL
jgi:hypothetical protein